VTGLGDRQRRRDRLEVAQLTDQDRIRIFAQGVLEGIGERLGVAADLALVDDASLVLVDELDRIFDGDDVAFSLAVDLVDHRGERRRLAAAGRP